jgi:hypothetical protein
VQVAQQVVKVQVVQLQLLLVLLAQLLMSQQQAAAVVVVVQQQMLMAYLVHQVAVGVIVLYPQQVAVEEWDQVGLLLLGYCKAVAVLLLLQQQPLV